MSRHHQNHPEFENNSHHSIVFVHGLTGNRETTWTEPESKVFWPEALLPGSIPTARIITFGYDADILHIFDSHKGHTLIDHASHLARALATLRSETSSRPLIFVAHSLGGLIVEQTLLDCRDSQDRNWNSVLESTIGIAYIGTPHTGPDLVRWERTLTYLATMLHKTDEHVQHVLTPGAKVLAGIEKEYLTLIEARKHAGKKPISLYCFYEALGVPGVGLVSFLGIWKYMCRV